MPASATSTTQASRLIDATQRSRRQLLITFDRQSTAGLELSHPPVYTRNVAWQRQRCQTAKPYVISARETAS